jgi:seryl-tRNA synthetase
MLQTNFIRSNKELVIERFKKRNLDAITLVDNILELDDKRKSIQYSLDESLAESNRISKEIGDLFKQGKKDEANAARAGVGALKNKIKDLEEEARNVQEDLKNALYQLPNVPHESVPAGSTDEDNEVYQDWENDLPTLHEGATPHWELAEQYDIFDMKLGVKITGAGFPVYKGKGAKLQRALISFFLDEAEKAGYLEIIPPLLVNEASATATGQLPDKEGQMYHSTVDDLYLIPTSEVPITNIYRDEIVDEKDFPIKMTGFTPCFRREAGAYGAHVRGLNRVHQFDKVEIIHITHPDTSYNDLHEMLAHVEGLLQKLELPYRILRLCGGDLGFTAALTFDFEVYSAAQGRWLEVSSVSNFETFQANRLKVRFKDKDSKKMRLAHTLNGSALALARIVAALLENNQTPEGIVIPEVLRPYTRFDIIN